MQPQNNNNLQNPQAGFAPQPVNPPATPWLQNQANSAWPMSQPGAAAGSQPMPPATQPMPAAPANIFQGTSPQPQNVAAFKPVAAAAPPGQAHPLPTVPQFQPVQPVVGQSPPSQPQTAAALTPPTIAWPQSLHAPASTSQPVSFAPQKPVVSPQPPGASLAAAQPGATSQPQPMTAQPVFSQPNVTNALQQQSAAPPTFAQQLAAQAATATMRPPATQPFDVDAAIRSTVQGPAAPLKPTQHQPISSQAVRPAAAPIPAKVPASSGIAPKSRKLIILIIAAVLLLGGGGGVAYFLYSTREGAEQAGAAISKEEADGLFVAVLSNSMDMGRFRQVFTYERAANPQSGITGTEKYVYTSDANFSDSSKPETKGTIDAVITGAERRIERKGEYVLMGDKNFVKLTDSLTQPANPSSDEILKKLEGKWFSLARNDEASDYLLSTTMYNTYDLFTAINRVGGEIVIGEVPEDTQENMLSFLFMREVYTLSSYVKMKIDDTEVVKYEIKVDKDAFIEFNSLLGATGKPIDSENVTEAFTLYADPVSKLPKRVTTSVDGTTLTVDYSNYTVPVLIDEPDAMTARQLVDAIE